MSNMQYFNFAQRVNIILIHLKVVQRFGGKEVENHPLHHIADCRYDYGISILFCSYL